MRSAFALAAAVALFAAPAAADKIVDDKNHFEIGLGKEWKLTQLSSDEDKNERLLVRAEHDSGEASAALVRINYPNTPVWRKKKHYVDDVLAGLASATDGYVLQSKKQSRIGRVPILDVSYKRKHDTHPNVAVRFVFRRTFTLIVAAPSTKAKRAAASKLARSLKPVL